MTPNELQEIIQSDKKLTIQEVEDIICELKNDTIEIQNDMLQKSVIQQTKTCGFPTMVFTTANEMRSIFV